MIKVFMEVSLSVPITMASCMAGCCLFVWTLKAVKKKYAAKKEIGKAGKIGLLVFPSVILEYTSSLQICLTLLRLFCVDLGSILLLIDGPKEGLWTLSGHYLGESYAQSKKRMRSLDQNARPQLDSISLDKVFTDKASAKDPKQPHSQI